VIHIIHGRLHAVPAVLAGALLGKPTLIKIGRGGLEHFDLDVINRKRLVGRWYARTVVRHATAYVANSREIAADLQRWGVPASKVHEIPNGIATPESGAERPRTDSLRFVFLGRLEIEKAIDLMIRGFARLSPGTRASLTVVGEGDCRHALERLVDELGLRPRVRFTGAVDDVSPMLRDADIFVSTSLSEGMSNALLEAMSFGLTPLVSQVSGVADIVEDGRSGLLFAPGNLDAFAAKLEEAVALPAATLRELGARARAVVTERFGIDEVATRHVALYEQLVADAR
jgi:glycosyltransferase involved in cell wall biosynthesis